MTLYLACNKILTDNLQEVEGVFSHIPYAEDFVNQDEKVKSFIAKSLISMFCYFRFSTTVLMQHGSEEILPILSTILW